MSEWIDKVAIITGASSGIGIGIAIEFAKHGCTVVLAGRDENNLKATGEKCKQLGLTSDKILCVVADMFIDDDVKRIVTKTVEKFGKINVLVNNAGMLKYHSVANINMKDYDDVMRVNLRSVVLLTQEALPHLIKTQGSVINISSVVSRQGWPNFLAYAMSKAALDHFTRCSAIDVAPKKVRFNSVQPGVIDTDIFNRAGANAENKKALLEASVSKHPMGRLGTPEDIGQACVYLASDKASFITGQTLCVDGGYPGTTEF